VIGRTACRSQNSTYGRVAGYPTPDCARNRPALSWTSLSVRCVICSDGQAGSFAPVGHKEGARAIYVLIRRPRVPSFLAKHCIAAEAPARTAPVPAAELRALSGAADEACLGQRTLAAKTFTTWTGLGPTTSIDHGAPNTTRFLFDCHPAADLERRSDQLMTQTLFFQCAKHSAALYKAIERPLHKRCEHDQKLVKLPVSVGVLHWAHSSIADIEGHPGG